MSRATVVTVACDLCSYGGAYTRPEDFVTINGVDLCKWCADDQPKEWMECGGHRVTFSADSWSCSCGAVYGSVVLGLRLRGVSLEVMDAAPSLAQATANIHVQA